MGKGIRFLLLSAAACCMAFDQSQAQVMQTSTIIDGDAQPQAQWSGYCGENGCGNDYFNCGCGNQWYFSGFGGLVDLDNFGFSGTGMIQIPGGPQANGTVGVDTISDDGWGIGFAIGRRLGCRTRIESEFTYRNNSIDSINIFTSINGQNANFPANVTGTVNSYSGMTNVLWDLKRLSTCRLTPYVGGGAGFIFIDSEFNPGAIPASISSDRSSFAYQGIAGVTMKWRQNVELFGEYRYLGTHEPHIAAAVPGATFNASSQYNGHNFFSGVRINMR